MKKESKAKAKAMLLAIHEAGLTEVVAGRVAYKVLRRVIDTGTSLPCEISEPDEDTVFWVEIFMDPKKWGTIDDDGWKSFCDTWIKKEETK